MSPVNHKRLHLGWALKKEKADQLPCGSTGTSSSNCQETETCMIQACHTPWHPLQNHPSGHPGGWVTPWSAEEMLDGQHQRMDIPAHARLALKGLLQKWLEKDLCWIPHFPQWPNRSRDWTELSNSNTNYIWSQMHSGHSRIVSELSMVMFQVLLETNPVLVCAESGHCNVLYCKSWFLWPVIPAFTLWPGPVLRLAWFVSQVWHQHHSKPYSCLPRLLLLFISRKCQITHMQWELCSVLLLSKGEYDLHRPWDGEQQTAMSHDKPKFSLHIFDGVTGPIMSFIIINPLTVRVVGAPQMILQPVFSIFSMFSTTLWDLPNSRPVHSLMLSSHLFLCLVFFPLSLCLARWFWPDLMNRRHDHATAIWVSLQSSGLCVIQLPAGS